jgi:hypothetical protein
MKKESQAGAVLLGKIGEADINLAQIQRKSQKDFAPLPYGAVKFVVEKMTGIKDSTFVDQLSFRPELLKWAIKMRLKNQPILISLLGKLSEESSGEHVDTSDALAVIEIIKPNYSLRVDRNSIESSTLRMSGLFNKDQDRIAMVNYHNGRLTEIKISVPEEEYLKHTVHFRDSAHLETTRDMSRNMNNFHGTSHLITRAMRDRIKSGAMLVYKVNENIDTPLFEKFGYDVLEKNGMIRIGLDTEKAREKGLVPWEIYVLRSLKESSIITSAFHGPLKS